MRLLVDNFFNKVLGALDATYFPDVKYYRDDVDCAKLHYQTELFNNGCINYDHYIKSVANLCNDTEENIRIIVDEFINWN